MQSQKSSTQEGLTPLPLPYGFGSMAMHGRVWWLIWRDAENKPHYENSETDDAAQAQQILAYRALARARAQVKMLERIAHGETYHTTRVPAAAQSKSRKRKRSRAVTPVGAAPSKAARKTGRKAGGKA